MAVAAVWRASLALVVKSEVQQTLQQAVPLQHSSRPSLQCRSLYMGSGSCVCSHPHVHACSQPQKNKDSFIITSLHLSLLNVVPITKIS